MGQYKYSNRRKPKDKATHSCIRCGRDLHQGNNTVVCDREYAECERRESDLKAIRAAIIDACPVR